MKNAITPTRLEDFAQWYQAVVKEADLAEMSHVRGCMVIKPWGYGLWEQIQSQLGARIKATGVENAYFPLFIPLEYIEKEAEHVAGFAKEMAIVTHHRLKAGENGLTLEGKLEQPLVVRPTSETIIGASMAKWINSHRDLPLKLNQWANVVRWEMRPRVFLRTVEFLWQEGHDAFAHEQEAIEDTHRMVKVYMDFVQEVLAIPVILGEKTASERFPGALRTLCIEAMMQDGKALQAGTSHYLGQNFAKASNIQYLGTDGQQNYVYTTSWGASTRLIGALIMTHSDDDGCRVPPRIAPTQIVIIPMRRNNDDEQTQAKVLEYCQNLQAQLIGQTFYQQPLSVKVDTRPLRSVELKWQWLKRGVPLVIEVGPRDIANDTVALIERPKVKERAQFISKDDLLQSVVGRLEAIQNDYFNAAKNYMNRQIRYDITDVEGLIEHFKQDKPGFVWAKFSGDESLLKPLEQYGVTIRCLPFERQNPSPGPCVLSGEMTEQEAVFAKAY